MNAGSGPGQAVETAGFVLGGGRSSRMGRDKALIELGGRTLVEQAVGILRDAGLSVAISGGNPDLARFAPVLSDERPGCGPLGGICAALRSTEFERAVFMTVDTPLIPSSLISALIEDAEITGSAVTVAAVNGATETFPAVISRTALPTLEAELAAGRLGCFRAFETAVASLGERVRRLPVELLVSIGQIADSAGYPPSRWFMNLNTPGDLAFAEVCLRAPIA